MRIVGKVEKQPNNYKQLDQFLEGLGRQSWKPILIAGSYQDDNFEGVIKHLRKYYPYQLMGWTDKALKYYFQHRDFGDLKKKEE